MKRNGISFGIIILLGGLALTLNACASGIKVKGPGLAELMIDGQPAGRLPVSGEMTLDFTKDLPRKGVIGNVFGIPMGDKNEYEITLTAKGEKRSQTVNAFGGVGTCLSCHQLKPTADFEDLK